MFEEIGVGAMYLHVQPPLALYASGVTSGCVVDSGEFSTSIFPVCEGYQLSAASIKSNFGGFHVTALLAKQLRAEGAGQRWLSSSSALDVARHIKERCGYVREDYCHGANVTKRSFTLPDGEVVALGAEVFRCCEKMFQPNLDDNLLPLDDIQPLHSLIMESIKKCDIYTRRTLMSNITLAGGNTMFPGLQERLSVELRALVPTSMASSVQIQAPEDRQVSVWKGGAVLTSLSTFDDLWLTQFDYQEVGANIIHERCPVYL